MRQTVSSLRERVGAAALALRNSLRRMVITATDGVLWLLDGFEDAEGNVEAEEAEVFLGIGFYSRPDTNSDGAEAVVIKIGGQSGHPAVVATRDQRALAAFEAAAGKVGPGEVVLFNANAMVRLTMAGEVLAGRPGGVAVALATKADVDALRNWVAAQFVTAGHTHTVSGSTTTAVNPATPPTPPIAAGTSRLRGE